jgi:hypothetical protein
MCSGRTMLAAIALLACSQAAGSPPPAPAPPAAQHEDFSRFGWKTDFTKHSVPLSEIHSGGPPRDGIPPLDHPKFVSTTEATSWLKGVEPVIFLDVGGDRRAYPLQIMIWHEIVNDQVGGAPVTVTFCPLCNSAIVFDRRAGGRVLDFGTSGNLRNSDLVMWDRQTESWWQQATATAIVGELTGTTLRFLPASIVSFDSFRLSHPDARVLSRDTGFNRTYGENPYPGYDDVKSPPFLFAGTVDGRLAPKERVVTVNIGDDFAAYPYLILQKRGVVADTVGGTAIVVFYGRGTVSALDGSNIPDSQDVGATGVFESTLDGRALTFRPDRDGFKDLQTGSHWNLLGEASSGSLLGRRLEPVVHGDYFWFAWAAFRPQTRIFRP